MNFRAMLRSPADYSAVSCVVGFGGFPYDIEHMLKQVGVNAGDCFGVPPDAVLAAAYLKKGTMEALHIVVDLRPEATLGEAVAFATDPAIGTWRRCDVPAAFVPLIREAQEREF